MNKSYRLIWSDVLEAWIAVAECVRARGKKSAAVVCLAALAQGASAASLVPPAATALPTGGARIAGEVAIAQSGTRMDVNQTSAKAIINWNSFDIGSSAHVHFNQPSASAMTLNRVQSAVPSQIFGRLSADGQILLINPSGVIFGAGARVDVGGIVASTLRLADEDFLAGNYRFTGGNGAGEISSQGIFNTLPQGYVALVAPRISNDGTINAPRGTAALAAGDTVTLTFANDRLISYDVSAASVDTLVANQGAIQTEGGVVLLTAKSAGELVTSAINNTGIIDASSATAEGGVITLTARTTASMASAVVSNDGVIRAGSGGKQGGQIRLESDLAINLGTLDASGQGGGHVDVSGRSVLQAGIIHADGDGGRVTIAATQAVLQTADGRVTADGPSLGGSISVQGGEAAFLSGNISASGERGGSIVVSGKQLTLAAANLQADGQSQGGSVLVGGDVHGSNPAVANAQGSDVNAYTTLTARGTGGKIVVWSDDRTNFYGQATTGNQGFIEVSGKNTLNYGGQVNAGVGGQVLFDPTNLIISASAPAAFYFNLADPNPASGDQHGSGGILVLPNGNVVVASPNDSFGASGAGAAYLYNGQTGALISTLTGSSVNDHVGNGGITKLSNGNYVVRSYNWANGAATSAGAVTWASGTAGISGVVSAGNSLVGSAANDSVGMGPFAVLGNGNYVVASPYWDNGGASNAGAVTWGNGATGTTGVVSVSNSLVGSAANDQVGDGGIKVLANNNYVVSSHSWANAGAANAGAVTWGSGTTGITGVVSSANSLVGSVADDYVGYYGVFLLSNGNYVVRSSNWNNGGVVDAGALTWANGNTGITGTVSSANSLVGTSFNDQVGYGGIIELSNGNFLVNNYNWNNGGATNAGAVTWVNGATGLTGAVSSANSLVGTTANDHVGNYGVVALGNGNYVVSSPNWSNGGAANAGAVTWGNGTTGITGAVSSANSLVGTAANDQVGISPITVLSNGNYVVNSPLWSNGGVANVGAVTWANGTTGITGAVSSANSLVGTTAVDRVGYGGVTALSNGNFVVLSPDWDNAGVSDAGAATWVNGTTGMTGAVSSANSLVGGQANDKVGSGGTTALTNGSYVVRSYNWANGAATNAGAVTWGNGTTGVTGLVSSANSLVGATANDQVGMSGVMALANGNYLVRSTYWTNGGATGAGAVTWGNGSTGVSGVLSSGNSLVGSTTNDMVGMFVTLLSNGNYVVMTPNWTNGAVANAGAVTWGSGTAGITGPISTANSLVGSSSNDYVGNGGITELPNGNYVIGSLMWANGGASNAGAVTWASGTNAIVGIVSGANSLVGTVANDNVGNGGITALGNSNYLVRSSNWTNGGLANAGAVWLAVEPSNLAATVGTLSGNTMLSPYALGAAAIAGSTLTLQASNDITINSAVSLKGALRLIAGHELILNAGISSLATGTAIELVTPTFTNNVGASGLTTPNGRWLVWTSPVTGTVGLLDPQGLAFDFWQFGATYGTDSVLGAGNGFLDSRALTLSFGLTGTVTKTYDSTATATLAAGNYSLSAPSSNGVLWINPNYSLPTTGTYSDKNAGSGKTVTVTGVSINPTTNTNKPVYGIDLASTSASANIGQITAANLSVSGLSASNKMYDGTLEAALVGIAAINPFAGDSVTLGGTGIASFADKNVGTGKPITVTGYLLSGADAGNYNLLQSGGLFADITAAILSYVATGTSVTVGAPIPALTGIVTGFVAGDTLSSDTTGTLSWTTPASSSSGMGKYAIYGGGLSASNYTFVQAAGNSQALTIAEAPSIQDSGTITSQTQTTATGISATTPVTVWTAPPTSTQTGVIDNQMSQPTTLSTTSNATGAGQAEITTTSLSTGTGSATEFAVASNAEPVPQTTQSTGPASATMDNAADTPADIGASGSTNGTPKTADKGADKGADKSKAENKVADTAVDDAPGSSGDKADRGAPKTADKSSDKAADKGAEKTADNASGKGSDKAADKGSEKGEKEASKTAEKTSEKSDGKAADKSKDKAEEKTAEKSKDKDDKAADKKQDGAGSKSAQKADSAAPKGNAAFARMNLAGMSPGAIQAMLTARHEHKTQALQEGLSKLEGDKSLGELKGCASAAAASGGDCLATAQQMKDLIRTTQPNFAKPLPAFAALPAIEKKVAVLIGSNAYQDPTIPSLESAVPDVEAVGRLLEQRLGYEVRILRDPGKKDMVKELNKLAGELDSNDSVTLYYAGHGYMVEKSGTGYWIPADAKASDPATWISNDDISKFMGQLPAKQVMLISDSCYSGSLTKGGGKESLGKDANASDILGKRSVVVMSSGAEEPVSDEGKNGHSIFAYSLMQALDGVNSWQTGSAVYEKVRAAVTKDFPQSPQYGTAPGAGHTTGGEYLLEIRRY